MDSEGLGHGETEDRSCLCCESVRWMLYFIIIKCLASLKLRDYFNSFNINESKEKIFCMGEKILMVVLSHLLIKTITYKVLDKNAYLYH